MEWNCTDIKYPTKYMQCLVILKGSKYIQCNAWNEKHQCWDDISGDDYMFDKYMVLYWMEFPNIPVFSN